MPPSAPTTPTSPFPSPGAAQPSSLARLTLSDKLLLSQAVHHIGSSPPDWGRVSSILLSHPLIKTKTRLEQAAKAGITLGRVFGSRECERAWVALMRQYNLVLQPGERESVNESDGESSATPTTLSGRTKEARGLPPRMDRASQLSLAQFLYAERIREIQETIKAKEIAFKALVAEIDALNAGTLDDKLVEELENTSTLQEQPFIEHSSKDNSLVEANNASGRGRNSRGGSVTNLPIVSPSKLPILQDLQPVLPDSPAAEVLSHITKRPIDSRHKTEDKDAKEASPSTDTEKSVSKSKDLPQNNWDAQKKGSDGEGKVRESETDHKTPHKSTSDQSKGSSLSKHHTTKGDTKRSPDSEKTARTAKRKLASEDGDSDASETRKRLRGTESSSREPSHMDDISEAQGRKKGSRVTMDDDHDHLMDGDETRTNTKGEETEEAKDDDDSTKRHEVRRSRRSGRLATTEESVSTPPPLTAKNNRVEALRSREASGSSQDGDEDTDRETNEVDNSQSTADQASRTSVSPLATRKSRTSGAQRSANARSSSTSRKSRTGEEEVSDAEREREKAAKHRKNEKVLMMLFNEVSNHTHGNLFHAPIREQDAPDYYALVRHPIDLKTIKARIKDGKISTAMQLRRALGQMFANSLIYNRPGTEVHRMALEMRDATEQVSASEFHTLFS